jgi:hypothetical protein
MSKKKKKKKKIIASSALWLNEFRSLNQSFDGRRGLKAQANI